MSQEHFKRLENKLQQSSGARCLLSCMGSKIVCKISFMECHCLRIIIVIDELVQLCVGV